MEVKGTTSNRLFKLLGPDEEEEDDKKVQGLDSDSKRSVEIRRIQAMKRKRRRKRVTDAAETSLASHLLSQKLSVTASTSIYGSGSSSPTHTSRLGLNSSFSRGLDHTQNRRSRYLLSPDDYRLALEKGTTSVQRAHD